jgi:hypothetical protein
VEAAVSRIAERHRLEAESLAIQTQTQSPPSPPKRNSTPQTFLDRTSRLALPHPERERGEILGPTRDLLVSGSGRVVGAVKKPLRGLGSFVFGEGGESPPDRPDVSRRQSAPEVQVREREEEAAARLANAEIERAERAEREQLGQTLEMLAQMFPGMLTYKNMLMEDLDREVVEAVIIAKEGRVGVCIDICLEMSSGINTPYESQAADQPASPETKSRTDGLSDEKDTTNTSDLLGLGLRELNLNSGDRGNVNGKPGERVDLMD